MVDPNRKINRLTDKDVEFLEECEREFAMRYTDDDAEFMAYCSKPLDDPPMLENWIINDFSGSRNKKPWRHNFKHRGDGRDRFDDRAKRFQKSRPSRPSFDQQQNSSEPPEVIRRQYNNFVAASKDD